MDEIRIAIVGIGGRALGEWIPHMVSRPGYRIVAVCDWIEPLMDKALALIPYRAEVRKIAAYEDVLACDDINAIGLTVRRFDQGAMAAQALEAGKHVHAEVPAAHTIEDCWKIVLAAERTGKLYHFAEQARYAGFVEAWKQVVDAGRIGRVIYAEGQYIGYYGTGMYYQDFKTGQHYSIEEAKHHPEAKPSILHDNRPIEYLPHELSPILKIMKDRVVQVVGMGTRRPSYNHPEFGQPDIEVALMKTEKDAILRMACGFTCPVPHGLHHWYHLHGTRGRIEWKRSLEERPKLWCANEQMHQPALMDWKWQRMDASDKANRSGHSGTDWHAHESFRQALLYGKTPELDVYGVIDTAAPAIRARQSIDRGSIPLEVPDFRPGPNRKLGEAPKDMT